MCYCLAIFTVGDRRVDLRFAWFTKIQNFSYPILLEVQKRHKFLLFRSQAAQTNETHTVNPKTVKKLTEKKNATVVQYVNFHKTLFSVTVQTETMPSFCLSL